MKWNQDKVMEKRRIEGDKEVTRRFVDSQYEEIFMEPDQMVRRGEQALRITDKTK